MPWRIFARRPDLKRDGQIDYTSAVLISRFNAVGSWELVVDGRSPLASSLAHPGWGIEAVNENNITVLAGPVDKIQRDRDETKNILTFYGSDDNVYLSEREAHPEPGTPVPPYNTFEYDIRSGVCSTVLRDYVNVNLGPGALGPRKQFGLTLATDPIVGTAVIGRARWQNLLEFLRDLALSGGDIGFRIQNVPGVGLQFQVFQPVDRSSTVVFSLGKGNLASYTYSAAKSKLNYVYLGADGEGTARTIIEGQDSSEITTWRRIETFVDKRDTSVTAELNQEISKQLQEGAGEVNISITPIDLPGSTYLTDYTLGDIVSVVVDDTVTQTIREVKITLSPGKAPQVLPTISTPGIPTMVKSKLFKNVNAMSVRVSKLERR